MSHSTNSSSFCPLHSLLLLGNSFFCNNNNNNSDPYARWKWSLVVCHHLLAGTLFRVFNLDVQLFCSIPCCSVCRIDRIVFLPLANLFREGASAISFLFWNSCFFFLFVKNMYTNSKSFIFFNHQTRVSFPYVSMHIYIIFFP